MATSNDRKKRRKRNQMIIIAITILGAIAVLLSVILPIVLLNK